VSKHSSRFPAEPFLRLVGYSKILFASCSKRSQRRGARRSMSGGVLLYVDAKSVERNEAYEAFSAACLVHFVTQLLGHFPGDSWIGYFFEGDFFAGELAQHLE
jgi:hypothetical protein